MIIDWLKLISTKVRWRLKNLHNEAAKLKIGNYCSIASSVMFILGADHSYKHISTYPFTVKCRGARIEAITKGDIISREVVL